MSPVTRVYGAILVGSTHPYFEDQDPTVPAGQEFEFNWVIEDRELFGSEALAFKSPLFRLPDISNDVSNGSSRIELQIEVPPFLTDSATIPCRIVLLSPPGDLLLVSTNNHHYVLRNKSGKEAVHFMINAEIFQKELRKSKFYSYDFHLRISKKEMDLNVFTGIPKEQPALVTPSAPTPAATSPTTDSCPSCSSPSPVAARLLSVLNDPPDEVVNLTFDHRASDLQIVAKKSILVAQSETFREMMKEMVRGSRLRVPYQFSLPTMKEVVRFLQFGYCENWESLVEEIAAAAVYFKVDQLQRLADHKRSLME